MKILPTMLIALAAATAASAQDPAAFEGGAAAEPGIKLGPAAGYTKSKDADDGTWFGGIAARMNLGEWLGAEASLTFRRDEFLDGDATLTTYPVQVTALVYPPLGDMSIRPYALAGFGWYYVRVDFDDSYGLDSETDSATGLHFGAGVELPLGPTVTGFIDARYVFVDEPGVDNSSLEDEEWDTVQIAFGVGFKF